MKLSKLFMMALLAGTLGAFGCSDDNGGTGGTGTGGTGGTGTGGSGGSGTGGSGGSTADPCTGPLCDDVARKEACDELIGECNLAVQVDIPPDTCDLIGNEVLCEEGAGGGGGTGGGGGAAGGEFGCDRGGCELDDTLKAQCEEAVKVCLVYCEGEDLCAEDECLALGLLICNVEEG
jgi:hypothetical protein